MYAKEINDLAKSVISKCADIAISYASKFPVDITKEVQFACTHTQCHTHTHIQPSKRKVFEPENGDTCTIKQPIRASSPVSPATLVYF